MGGWFAVKNKILIINYAPYKYSQSFTDMMTPFSSQALFPTTFNGQVQILHLLTACRGMNNNELKITHIMFIEIWMDFQFINAHCALKWIKHRILWNANGWENWCNLFPWFFATGCRQNKWKFLWYKNLRFHLGTQSTRNHKSINRLKNFN